MASNIVLEVYDLCADKAMLESALQEEQEKARLYNTELDNLGAEYEVMVQNYAEELAASRANQETLMVNHEKVVVLLEKVKLNEDLKGRVRGLEAELKASELEASYTGRKILFNKRMKSTRTRLKILKKS